MARALIVVDYQNDFAAADGALAVAGGEDIAARIDELAHTGGFDLVVATRDWHPADHGSFAAQGGVWPVHCVQGTPGAQLHPALDRDVVDLVVDKGQASGTDGYSAFDGTELAALLRERGIDALTVVGLATDYCVRHTALDALRAGFSVRIDERAVAGVDAGAAASALAELRGAGADVG